VFPGGPPESDETIRRSKWADRELSLPWNNGEDSCAGLIKSRRRSFSESAAAKRSAPKGHNYDLWCNANGPDVQSALVIHPFEGFALVNPLFDRLLIEAPVRAHLEGGDLLLLQQSIDRGGMDL
jgi:hypothetical protein